MPEGMNPEFEYHGLHLAAHPENLKEPRQVLKLTLEFPGARMLEYHIDMPSMMPFTMKDIPTEALLNELEIRLGGDNETEG